MEFFKDEKKMVVGANFIDPIFICRPPSVCADFSVSAVYLYAILNLKLR